MNMDELRGEGKVEDIEEGYQTIQDIHSVGVVLSEDGTSAGLLIRPMDIAPLVIGVGSVADFKDLVKYLSGIADDLE